MESLVKKEASQIAIRQESSEIYALRGLAELVGNCSNEQEGALHLCKGMNKLYAPVRSVEQAIACKSHGLSGLRRTLGSKKVEALIKLQLVYLNDMLNLKRPLGPIEIDEIAHEVMMEFYNLTMADVYLVMKRARTGYYGEFYESINMPKVMKWFRDYFEERCAVGERRSRDAAAQHKEWVDPDRAKDLEREAFQKARTWYLIEQGRKKAKP